MTIQESVYTKEIVAPVEKLSSNASSDLPDAAADDNADVDIDSEDTVKQLTATQFYDAFVRRTPDQCASEMMAPQRSAEWHMARNYCITASNFGAAIGSNRYSTPDDLVRDKLWSTFKGNSNTAYGSFHENDARDSFKNSLDSVLRPTLQRLYESHFHAEQHSKNSTPEQCGPVASQNHYVSAIIDDALEPLRPTYVSYSLVECGLLKSHEQSWMAVSPDGLLYLDGTHGRVCILVEYKCPVAKRDSDDHPYKTSKHNVPAYYMDQVQGIMGYLNKYPQLIGLKTGLKAQQAQDAEQAQQSSDALAELTIRYCFFVAWQPRQHHMTLVPFDQEGFDLRIEPHLTRWYFDRYLPMAVMKYNKELVPGTINRASVIYTDLN